MWCSYNTSLLDDPALKTANPMTDGWNEPSLGLAYLHYPAAVQNVTRAIEDFHFDKPPQLKRQSEVKAYDVHISSRLENDYLSQIAELELQLTDLRLNLLVSTKENHRLLGELAQLKSLTKDVGTSTDPGHYRRLEQLHSQEVEKNRALQESLSVLQGNYLAEKDTVRKLLCENEALRKHIRECTT